MQLLKDMSVGAFLRGIVLVKKRKYFYLRPVIDYERLTGIRLLGISLACQLALYTLYIYFSLGGREVKFIKLIYPVFKFAMRLLIQFLCYQSEARKVCILTRLQCVGVGDLIKIMRTADHTVDQ